ncbi:unnamed protein product, partial [marine sediment metagenome]
MDKAQKEPQRPFDFPIIQQCLCDTMAGKLLEFV